MLTCVISIAAVVATAIYIATATATVVAIVTFATGGRLMPEKKLKFNIQRDDTGNGGLLSIHSIINIGVIYEQ